MSELTVEDEIRIKASAETTFAHITQGDLIEKWWPKACESDPRQGGVLRLTWFSDDTMETAFDVFDKPNKVAYDFYIQRCEFDLEENGEYTTLKVRHSKVEYSEEDVSGPIHVAQSWSALLTGLRVLIEHGIDVRGEV